MSTPVTATTLSGMYKERYGDQLINLVPETSVLTKEIKFDSAKRLGDYYNQPVIVRNEQGFTYSTTDAFTMNGPSSMIMQNAKLQGSMIAARSEIGYRAATAAVSSEAAFGETFDVIVKNLYESMTKRLEIGLLYGGSGLGVIASGTNATTSETVTLTAASWSSGIWGGMENAQVNVYYGSGHDAAGGTLVSSAADSIFTVTSITLPTSTTTGGTITLTGTQTGCSALDSAITGNASACSIYFLGAHNVEAVGLKRILTNTGTLFNVDAGSYNLWQANSLTVTGSLSMKQLQYAIGVATSRGLAEDVKCFISPNTWTNLLTNETALRRYDGSYSTKELENGAEAISFHSQNGKVEVVSHIFVKDGDCFIVPTKRLRRVGSSDITQTIPGSDAEDIFLHRPETTSYELRLFSDQALFLETPARAVYVTGYTNSN